MINSSKTLNRWELSTANFCTLMPSKAGSSNLRSRSIARTLRRKEISSITKKPWTKSINLKKKREGRKRTKSRSWRSFRKTLKSNINKSSSNMSTNTKMRWKKESFSRWRLKLPSWSKRRRKEREDLRICRTEKISMTLTKRTSSWRLSKLRKRRKSRQELINIERNRKSSMIWQRKGNKILSMKRSSKEKNFISNKLSRWVKSKIRI